MRSTIFVYAPFTHLSGCFVRSLQQCVVAEQYYFSERAERSEHIWPQIIVKFQPTSANIPNQPKSPKANIRRPLQGSPGVGYGLLSSLLSRLVSSSPPVVLPMGSQKPPFGGGGGGGCSNLSQGTLRRTSKIGSQIVAP